MLHGSYSIHLSKQRGKPRLIFTKMETTQQKTIREFEEMRERAMLGALSATSLKRPLTDAEFQKFKMLGEKYLI